MDSCQTAPSLRETLLPTFLPPPLALEPFLLPFLLTYFKMNQIQTILDQIFWDLQKGQLGLDTKMDKEGLSKIEV